MQCPYANKCGGCPYRSQTLEAYQKGKREEFIKKLSKLVEQPEKYGQPIFIEDGQRRRASLAFEKKKGKIVLGFNAHHSKEIVDIESCSLLTDKLNRILRPIKQLLEEMFQTPVTKRPLKKKIKPEAEKGDIWLCEADNGIDIVLEMSKELGLNEREILADFLQREQNVIRIAQRFKKDAPTETIIEKAKPIITMGGREVYIPSGTFLQASKAAETALINQVQQYIGDDTGLIADLFCGVGTFSYPLSRQKENKIVAADSNTEALRAFEATINKNKISNIKIIERNLFRYPLDKDELQGFDIIIFDPPRAGAKNQIHEITKMSNEQKPKKIIGISCNPDSFVSDANELIKNGYTLKEVTLVDQFVYSPHMELTALFVRKTL